LTAPVAPADSRDLETIVCLLEMAAISLTTMASRTFTRDELVTEARMFGGPDIALRELDVDLVIRGASFLRRAPRGRLRLR